MKKFKSKKEKGITLVALVVTIVVLIILSTVSINTMFGDNGIISKAKKTKEVFENSKASEDESLAKLLNGFESEDIPDSGDVLPDNSSTNPQPVGTEVKLKDGWGTETVKHIKTSDGEEATEITKVSTVYAVSVGGGETVPVPKNFYYVGGNLSTGVIISDNKDDKYEAGKDKTTYDYTTSLKGNQFVWVPCDTSNYVKKSWGKQNAEWDTTTPKPELTQIEKYGGFYVGRYEAGLASNIKEFSKNQTHTGSNQIYNLEGVPQSKAGIVPWDFIDWTHAKANAERMYNNSYVSSGLITGTQWDVILNTLINKKLLTLADISTDSNTWGNYMNTSIAYNGRLSKSTYSSNWITQPFGTSTSGKTTSYSSNNGELLTTGASSVTEKYHIFDLAGNVWEWTEEDSHYATSGQYRVSRGGSYIRASSTYPACYRPYYSVSHTTPLVGFRAVLYIK